MHTECPDVRAGFAAHPEDSEMSVVVELVQLRLMDRPDAQLPLDGRDQGRSLEQGSCKGLEGSCELCLASRKSLVESNDADVLLSGPLLRLDQTRRPVQTHDQASRHLGVEGSAVAGFLDPVSRQLQSHHQSAVHTRWSHLPEHPLDPSDNFMTGRVRGFVEIDDAGADVGLEVALQGGTAVWDGSEVAGSDEDCHMFRSEKLPISSVSIGCSRLS